MSRFTSPRAQMQAVTEAARKSPRNTQRAIDSFFRDRLLCRMFSEADPSFILKGGQGMLARTDTARETRDIDILGMGADLRESLTKLKRLAALDLDDFLSFEFVSAEPIKATEEYREGLAVKFTVFCGPQRQGALSIDLVSDPAFHGQPQRVSPKARLAVGDLPVFDYLLYPIENVIADKVCATYETHGGRPSSRVKDLVDLGVISLTETVDGSRALVQLALELKLRKIDAPSHFCVPAEWKESYSLASYEKLVKQTAFAEQLADMSLCLKLVGNLADPLLDQSARERTWDPSSQQWLVAHTERLRCASVVAAHGNSQGSVRIQDNH